MARSHNGFARQSAAIERERTVARDRVFLEVTNSRSQFPGRYGVPLRLGGRRRIVYEQFRIVRITVALLRGAHRQICVRRMAE